MCVCVFVRLLVCLFVCVLARFIVCVWLCDVVCLFVCLFDCVGCMCVGLFRLFGGLVV